MRSLLCRAAVGVCLSIFSMSGASAPGGSRPVYPQLVCVVPIIGTGTLAAPRRPLSAPVAGAEAPTHAPSKGFRDAAAITASRSVLSDDGLFAIVLFEAHDRAAFKPILNDKTVLQRFDLSNTTLNALLPALRVFKKNFDIRMLQGGAL